MTFAALLLLLILALFAARGRFLSFRSQSPADYAGTGPAFRMQETLNGPIQSEGLIYGPNGKMSTSFVARMDGQWDGNRGTLDEYFTYSNGTRMARRWYLTLGPGDTFTATADDIVGEGRGTMSGATVKLSYRIILPAAAGGHVLDVTDWMYLTENGVIMNRSEMRKFGIKVAELVATMRPVPEPGAARMNGASGQDVASGTRPIS